MKVVEHDEFLESFKIEALELLISAEADLLKVESNQTLTESYDAIFRALHSVKGGAGLFEMMQIQKRLHQAETIFVDYKGKVKIEDNHLKFLLEVIGETIAYFEGKPEILTESFPESSSIASSNAPIENTVIELVPIKIEVKEKILKQQKLIAVCIDDELGILEILSDELSAIGMDVHIFTNPVEALAAIEKIQPDVVLSDIMMPELTGLQVLKEIKKFKKDYPVIFCSGAFDRNILMEAINNGAEGVVEKPFDFKFLINVALNAARKSRLMKMMDQTINLLMYQYTDFDDYLKANGKEDIRRLLEEEMTNLIEQRSLLREVKNTLNKKTS